MNKLTTPKWIEEGPLDLEYKTYKFLQRVAELDKLIDVNLMSALWEIDDTLDYIEDIDNALRGKNENPITNPEILNKRQKK